MDDIGAILFLIIFAISLIGSVIQKFTGAGQQEPDEDQRPERPRAQDLPAATRRQIYGTGSPRAAELDEDDEETVVPIPVPNQWQQRQQQQRRSTTAPPPTPTQRETARGGAREQESFRAKEQAPWRPADQPRTPEAAQQASSEAAERARRQREMQRERARESARGSARGDMGREAAAGVARLADPKSLLASNEGRMRAQREKMAEALKKRNEARDQLATTRRGQDFRSAPAKRMPRRSAQLTQLGRLMRNERAIRTGIIFSEVLGKPKALREETGGPPR